MEEWEVLLDQYESFSNCKIFETALQVAQSICDKDLAPFEIDWFLESLLKKPVELFKTLLSKRNEDEWTKALEKSFSLLSVVIEKLPNAELYYEDIVKLCNLTYTARVTGKALECLTQLARRYSPSASVVNSQIDALCYNETCKALRISLLGVLCEYHPELFSNITSLWRAFINLLDSQGSKVSLNVVRAVLEAVCGLLKHFGTDLVVSELYEFYHKMTPFLDKQSVDYGRTRKKCQEVCCIILEKYSDLFKERVSADIELRSNLWNTLTVATRLTVIAVYRTCFKDGGHLQQIRTELINKADSKYPLVRYTALRILSEASRDDTALVDVLANMLRDEHASSLASKLALAVDYDTAEAIAWCIYANVLYSDRLLQASILYYDSFPTTMRKRAVVYNILEAPSDLRVPAITFLINETCTIQDPARKDILMSLWKDLFDSKRGTDLLVLEHSQRVFEDFLEHVVFVLDTFLLEDLEELPPKLCALLKLTAYILNIQDIVNNILISSLCRLVERYARTYPCAEVVSLVRACSVVEGESVEMAYKYINIMTCIDEEHLLETCLALIEAASFVDSDQVLLAAKILLSNPDTEAEILSKTLKKLEHIMLMHKKQFEKTLINEVVCSVEKIRKRNNLSSKDDRMLHRDAVMFLGKFGSNDIYNKVHNTDDVLIAGLKELCLNVPIPSDSSTLKLNLHGVLEQAIEVKDPDVLETVITVICGNSQNLGGANISAVVSVALAAASRRAALASRAAPLCGPRGAAHLLRHLLKETSPQARKALLEALEIFLTTGTHVQISELADNLIVVCDEKCQGKLDLLSVLIRALKENNVLSQKHLPHVVIKVLKTQLPKTCAVFDDVTRMFIDKISLFESKVITTLIYDILNCLSANDFEINAKSKKLVVNTVSFLKRLKDLVLHLPDMLEMFDVATRDVTPPVLVLLSRLRCGFDCQLPFCREYVLRKAEFFDKLFDSTVATESVTEYLCAILDFVATFSDVLLEVHYEKTLHLLSRIIESITPLQTQHIHTNLSNCMFTIRNQLKSVPQMLNNSFIKWFHDLPLAEISLALSKCDYTEHTVFIDALERMLPVFEVKCCPFSMELCKLAQQWLGYVRGEDRYEEYSMHLHSLVRICIMVLPVESVQAIVFREKDDTIKFCQTFIAVFSDFFILNHSVLSGEHSKYSAILNDVVRHRVKSGRTEELLAAIDKIWPTYELNSNFKQKHTLLLDISHLTSKLPPESNPMRWLVSAMTSNATSNEDKIRLLSVVPGGEAYSSTYRQFASTLPTRLSELNAVTSAALQALLDNFAATRDTVVMDIIASLADGDTTKGWWDQVIDGSMKEVASTVDLGLDLLKAVYTVTWEGRTVGVCERLLIPLLRYTTPTLCEEFFSTVLEELFSVLKKRPREVSASTVYQKCVLDYIRAFNILRIAFEKIPKQHLESPESLLYSKQQSKAQKPYFIVYNICVFGVELRRNIICPVLADDALKDIVRMFHCSALNCMATALCCRNPKPDIYATVFGVDVWSPTVNPRTTYHLPLTEEWRQLTTRQAVSIDISDGEHSFLSAGTKSRTVHFIGTLSENPFLYDIPDVDEMATTQELILTDNPLNQHECAATLTALFCRAATYKSLVEKICEGLNRGPVNMRWLMAQIVCNCKEELKPHATIVRPALFTLIVNTTEDNKLNRLHMEILKTIIYWREETNELPDSFKQDFNKVIKCIILTIKDYKNHYNIANSVTDKLYQLCDMYGRHIEVSCDWFDTASNTNVGTDTKQIELKILKVLAKTNVDMTVLIPKIFEIFETGLNNLNIELPKLFGIVLNTVASHTASGYVAKFRGLVEGLRRSCVGTYIKVVYYTQKGYPGCCDEKIIREIIDLVYKIPGKDKVKCLDIISTYLSFASLGQHVDELFDMLDISQLLLNGEGLNIVVKGLPIMEEGLRRRVVRQVADGKWPPSAGGDVIEVMLKALEVSLPSTTIDEPPSKKRSTISPLLSKELQSVISCLTAGLGSQEVMNRVAACMSKEFAARFCEAFLIAVYSPVASRKHDVTNASYLTLELFFHELRRQDGFKVIRLRNEPLDYGERLQANTSKTTTKSLSQFGRQVVDGKDAEHQAPLDVQMPIEDVFKSILAFAKANPSVADDLCLQIARSTRSAATDATVCDFLLPLLESNPTPFVVEMCRVYVDSWCNIEGFQKAIEGLVKRCTGTEGHDLVVTLHQDMVLRSHRPLQFVMGSYDKYEDSNFQDVALLSADNNLHFLISDMINIHGELSNMENLTVQQRKYVIKKLSRLWTDEETFKNSLNEYEGGLEWFDAMLSVYRYEGLCHKTSRLLKRLDAWPRNSFDIAAVAEALEWQQIKEKSRTEEDLYKLTCSIGKNDCLAKWATRLMLRRLFLNTLNFEQDSDASDKERTMERSLSLSYQLQWCKSANERGLPMLALQCLEDVSGLYESETLKWLEQKIIAVRALASSSDSKNEALQLYDYSKQFQEVSSLEDKARLEYQKLLILVDLKHHDINMLQDFRNIVLQCVMGEKLSIEFKKTVDSICVFLVTTLHDLWRLNEDRYNTEILTEMSKVLQMYVKFNIGSKATVFADVILTRLRDVDRLTERVSSTLLESLMAIKESLDDFALDALRKNAHIFTTADAYRELFEIDHSTESCKKMLCLVADPKYSLMNYCCGLKMALQEDDEASWKQTFKRMQAKIFENPFAGSDYQVLFQHKNTLYNIIDYDTTKTETKQKILSQLISQLSAELKSADRRSLSLHQLCPQLCDESRSRDRALRKLMCLPMDGRIEFEEMVCIYTDTIRRAAVLSVRVRGAVRRYVVKGGEPLRLDAAAVRLRAALRALGVAAEQGYRVTPLSEDCGLIEYLENHERLRTLIMNSAPIDVAGLVSSLPRNDNQILCRRTAVEQFENCCSKVPSYLLRSAMELNSTSVEDYMSKKAEFMESLSAVTVVNWLLGVGDRHLENIMYNYRNGAVCNIDWGAMFQYGGTEVPCSRLTRNLLAVCDLEVLESKLQTKVQRMRDNRVLLSAVLNVSFNWMNDFDEKIVYMQGLLNGTTLSYQITKEVLQKSNVKYKEKYVELLDEVFAEDFETKNVYSVSEQISCLLRQSTDYRILSVTRAKWEPWL